MVEEGPFLLEEMKSTEAYKLLREEMGPWTKAQGFKRAKSMLSWYRPHKDKHIVFWFQVSKSGWDAFAGSQFTVEFQLSHDPIVGAGDRRERLGKLLSDSVREELRGIQNSVILSLPKPPADYFIFQLSENIQTWYLRGFEPVTEPYSQNTDIWLRYYTSYHVRRWGQFVLQQLPQCIKQAEEWV